MQPRSFKSHVHYLARPSRLAMLLNFLNSFARHSNLGAAQELERLKNDQLQKEMETLEQSTVRLQEQLAKAHVAANQLEARVAGGAPGGVAGGGSACFRCWTPNIGPQLGALLPFLGEALLSPFLVGRVPLLNAGPPARRPFTVSFLVGRVQTY